MRRTQASERLGLRKRDFLFFGFAAAALLAVGFTIVREHRQISLSHKRVSAALIALQSAENVSALLLKAETAQRGFLLTGSEIYLQPYFSVVHEMPAALRDFDQAIQNIHMAPGKGHAVLVLVAAKLDEMSETIKLYRKFHPDRATELAHINVGKRLMDEFLIRNNEIRLECAHVLTRESDKLREGNESVLYIAILGFPAVLLTLVVTALRLRALFRRQLELLAENQRASEQYRLLAGHLDTVREEERSHLAREIHDVLGQALTVTKLHVTMARRQISVGNTAFAVTKLDNALSSLDDTIRMSRQVATELRPPLLDSLGLQAALSAYIRELEEKTHLKIHFESPAELPHLTAKQSITAYRICQESLTNVVRHAQAEEVSISLLRLGEAITLSIKDNGLGFSDSSEKSRKSFGLLGMQERAQLIEGELLISSGNGTTVTLQFPIVSSGN